MQIMRVVLGETCTRFRPGPDGGRDGWFQGTAAHLLLLQNQLSGSFIIQCKHSSSSCSTLGIANLQKEIRKIEQMATKTPCNYILMTNRQVPAQSEAAIRQAFEVIDGIERCLVLSEAWIEDTIDAHPRLLRLVPRLYGIGDLSQILSSVIQQQSAALLEDLAHSLRTFVPTSSYRRAERSLYEHGFVVLVGSPASGKSTIAANLCMVSTAQDAATRVLRVEHADQFKNTWSPADTHTIYWVDDVFGETTLDDGRLREWSAALEKVETARKRGARIIFCTRDYILAAAERRLKKVKVDILNDARIRVDVAELSESERDSILYNHIKEGDIAKEQKRALKEHLSGLARLRAFSPELARRLGSRRFHQNLTYDWLNLRAFFEQPVQHFRDIIHGLAASETAALAVCLLSNNAVPDPVPDDALVEAVLRTYGVSMHQVREAFEMLEGSLVKRVRNGTAQTWQVHHPSMIEALQEDLSSKSSQLVLYLQSARVHAILRDTTTFPPAPGDRLVFLPAATYSYLIARLRSLGNSGIEAVAQYLAWRCSDEFLLLLDVTYPELLDRCLSIVPEPYGEDIAPCLAIRLASVRSVSLLGDARRAALVATLSKSANEYGWSGFLDLDGIGEVAPDFVANFLSRELANKFQSVERLYDYCCQQELSSKNDVYSAIGELESHAVRLLRALTAAGLLSDTARADLDRVNAIFQGLLDSRIAEIEEYEERRADFYEDEWKEQRYADRYERERGRFADVDE